MERVKTVMEILDKMNFFQGQRAGRELWNDKPFEVQEEDLGNFKRDIDTIGSYIWEIVKELKQYRDAEEQGLLLLLPCKVGNNVYCLTSAKTKIVETSILWIEKHSNCLVFALAGGFGDVVSENLGKTWFLTKEEAEQALARMEKENG